MPLLKLYLFDYVLLSFINSIVYLKKKIIISFKLAAIHQEQYNRFYGRAEMKLKVLESIGLAGSKNLRGGYGTIE